MKNTLLSIKHETLYKYTAPVGYTIQQLRVIPRHEDHQRIVSWQVKTIGKTHAFEDAFGNSCEMLTLTAPHKEIKIIATGTVEIAELDHGRIQDKSQLSPLTYTVPTQLTEPSEIIREFAAKNLSPKTNTAALLDLASAIRGSVKTMHIYFSLVVIALDYQHVMYLVILIQVMSRMVQVMHG
jgi:transglutaminase-like putative cysteine protease